MAQQIDFQTAAAASANLSPALVWTTMRGVVIAGGDITTPALMAVLAGVFGIESAAGVAAAIIASVEREG